VVEEELWWDFEAGETGKDVRRGCGWFGGGRHVITNTYKWIYAATNVV
jgi:hypothetical protein